MTKRKSLKRLIRERMARTGQSYSTARATLLWRSKARLTGKSVEMVPVDDPDAAIERYRELGFELSYRADDDSWIQLTDGTTTIALVPK